MLRLFLLLPIFISLFHSLPAKTPEPVVGPVKGSLVIMGGGGKDQKFEEIFRKFVQLAGGREARIVIIPTAASSDPEYPYLRSLPAEFARKILGAKEVTVLHTHDKKTADSEDFIQPLKRATGVWFGGGRQWRLTKAYGGTLTEAAFHAILQRGGVIGGSSAGATIQGSFLARGDTSGNTIMIGDVQRGFAFLKDTAIDQHVIARQRQKDLIELLEDPKNQMRQEFNRQELLGIGIDEDVALIVEGDQLEVIGKKHGTVLIYDPKKWTNETPDHKKWITLKTGDRYHLGDRKVIAQ